MIASFIAYHLVVYLFWLSAACFVAAFVFILKRDTNRYEKWPAALVAFGLALAMTGVAILFQ